MTVAIVLRVLPPVFCEPANPAPQFAAHNPLPIINELPRCPHERELPEDLFAHFPEITTFFRLSFEIEHICLCLLQKMIIVMLVLFLNA